MSGEVVRWGKGGTAVHVAMCTRKLAMHAQKLVYTTLSSPYTFLTFCRCSSSLFVANDGSCCPPPSSSYWRARISWSSLAISNAS